MLGLQPRDNQHPGDRVWALLTWSGLPPRVELVELQTYGFGAWTVRCEGGRHYWCDVNQRHVDRDLDALLVRLRSEGFEIPAWLTEEQARALGDDEMATAKTARASRDTKRAVAVDSDGFRREDAESELRDSALAAGLEMRPPTPPPGGRLELIAIDMLHPSPRNPRGPIQQKSETWRELVESVRQVGILQPLVVRPLAFEFEIVAGHRRHMAARAAGLTHVPCMVHDLDDRAAVIVAVNENKHREDLTPLEQADSVALLLEVGLTLAEAADKLGTTPSWAARRVKLRDLTPKWRKQMADADDEVSRWPALWLEPIAALPPHVQDEVFEDKLQFIDSLDDVRQAVADRLKTLDHARFDVGDETLLPAAGPCTRCPKRSSRQPLLFDDAPRGTNPDEIQAGDTCLDGACFTAKVQAYAERQARALKDKHGDRLVVLGNTYSPRDKAAAAAISAPLVDQYAVRSAKKTDPGAKLAIDLDTGATKWIAPPGRGGSSAESTSKPAHSATKLRELRRRRHVMTKVRDLLSAYATLKLTPNHKWGLRDVSLEAAASLALCFGTTEWRDPNGLLVAEADTWKPADVVEVAPAPLLKRLLLQRVLDRLARRIRVQGFDMVDETWPQCELVCELLEIDIDALKAEALQMFPEPATRTAKPSGAKKAKKNGRRR